MSRRRRPSRVAGGDAMTRDVWSRWIAPWLLGLALGAGLALACWAAWTWGGLL